MRAWRVEYLGGGQYTVHQYGGAHVTVEDPHWSFFTWSDGSLSNYTTVEASCANAAIGKALAMANPCGETVDRKTRGNQTSGGNDDGRQHQRQATDQRLSR